MDTTTRSALRATGLDRAMQRCDGHPSIGIGILDGPVAAHPALGDPGRRSQTTGPATVHATMVAGALAATRGHGAPGICPRCRLIVRPIFRDDGSGRDGSGRPR
ncbi:hypothetical protein ACFVJ5_30370 [Nocardia sp. NPDC127606]|uniref:hypothetical protein n=1 Tax=Nocardia sp. NPDC127606 TaxID=3345406 RepID=UPI003643C538